MSKRRKSRLERRRLITGGDQHVREIRRCRPDRVDRVQIDEVVDEGCLMQVLALAFGLTTILAMAVVTTAILKSSA